MPVSLSFSSKDTTTQLTYDPGDIVGNTGGFTPSAISSINGQDPVVFLTRYSELNSFGTVEAHADFNQLFDSPALDIQYEVSSFDISSPFYYTDILNIALENGTTLPTMEFQANANFDFGTDLSCVTSALDFYNMFVVLTDGCPVSSDEESGSDTDGETSTSASTDPPTATSSSSATDATSTSDVSGDEGETSDEEENDWSSATSAYPIPPDVAQPNLGLGGWLSGYFLNQSATGVLSIPSFEMRQVRLARFFNMPY